MEYSDIELRSDNECYHYLAGISEVYPRIKVLPKIKRNGLHGASEIPFMKLAKAMFVDVNPIPVKEAVSLIGFNAGPCRLPLIEMDEKNKAYVKATMEEYGLVK